jgi:hypothetical protein
MSAEVTYISHDENGEITAITSGPRAVIEPPEGAHIDYSGDQELGLDWYVFDNELLKKPEQPSKDYLFDTFSGEWVFDLELGKQNKWNAIKAARDAQEFASFEWGDYTFDCDEVSQRRLQGVVQLSAIDSTLTLDWTLADNSVVSLGSAEYILIGQALAVHVGQCHERGRILRAEIDAATTLEGLEAIVW